MTQGNEQQQATDYETHHAMLFIGNDPYWQKAAQKYVGFTGEFLAPAQRLFAMELKDEILDASLPRDTFYGFQLFLALRRINWQNVAATLIANARATRNAA